MGNDLPDSRLSDNQNNKNIDNIRYESARVFVNKILFYVELPFIRSLRHKIFVDEQLSLSVGATFTALLIIITYAGKSPMAYGEFNDYSMSLSFFITLLFLLVGISVLSKATKSLLILIPVVLNITLVSVFNKIAFFPQIDIKNLEFWKNLLFFYLWWLSFSYSITVIICDRISYCRRTGASLLILAPQLFIMHLYFFAKILIEIMQHE